MLKEYIEMEPFELFEDNGAKILGVAHSDTVFDGDKIPLLEGEGYTMSGKLDDRLGVYALLEYLKGKFEYDILITTDEEICCSTARLFDTNKQYNWIFELDRSETDLVTYQYDWEPKDFEIGRGSYSDIVDLEHLGCQAINVGIGYHDQHNINCYVKWSEFYSQMNKLKELAKNESNRYKVREIEEECYIGRYSGKGEVDSGAHLAFTDPFKQGPKRHSWSDEILRDSGCTWLD